MTRFFLALVAGLMLIIRVTAFAIYSAMAPAPGSHPPITSKRQNPAMATCQGEVDAAYAAALATGGTDEGAAGPRPMYGPNFYGAYVRDPAGNKMSFVFDIATPH
jgi:hypothetical protein